MISYLGVECVAQIFLFIFFVKQMESHVEFSKPLGKWCTKPSFISSNASLSVSVSAFAFSIGGSIAKSWSSSSEELSISLLSSMFIRKSIPSFNEKLKNKKVTSGK